MQKNVRFEEEEGEEKKRDAFQEKEIKIGREEKCDGMMSKLK